MKMKRWILWILCAVLLVSFQGCGAAKETEGGSGASDGYLSKEEVELDGETTSQLPENRKLIQTVRMGVETEDMSTVLQTLEGRVASLGGYIESSNVQNGSAYSTTRYRSASVTARIPAKDLDAFLNHVGEITNVVSSQKTVEDVTLNYVATESRVKALQAEEGRLLELMEKAATLDELLTVEKRLTEVRTELEKVTSSLNILNHQVDFATVYLNVTEVKEYTDVAEPESVWGRIGKGFVESLKGVGSFFTELFVFVIVSLPYLAVIAVIPVVILLILRSRKKKK